MERKKTLALTSLLTILLASFAMFPQPVMAQWTTDSFDTDGDAVNDVDIRTTAGPPRKIHIDTDRDGVVDANEYIHTLPDGGGWAYGQPMGPGTALKVVVNLPEGTWKYTINDLNADGDTSDPGECTGTFEARYVVMGGTISAWTQLGPFPVSISPYATRPPDLTPLLLVQNTTFSTPWFYNDTYGWLVNMTVSPNGFVSVYHEWWDEGSEKWFNLHHYLTVDGYGWAFLNASCGDVDCYTFNNASGVYWDAPGDPYGFNGTLAAETGDLPDPGPDGVAGTGDDGFGDGTLDPAGSSILLLPSRLRCEWSEDGATPVWNELFDIEWPVVFVTGTSYDIVRDSTSLINGKNGTETGEPWEFIAGVQHPPAVSYGHPKWNAYATYACAWSMINITTEDFGRLDVMYWMNEKTVRADCVIADIDCNEIVDIVDIVICALTYEQEDEKFGKKSADPDYDARGDVADPRGYVDIVDIVRIAINYDWQLTPNCILK